MSRTPLAFLSAARCSAASRSDFRSFTLASLVLNEILSVGLFGDDEAGVTAFAEAINTKLDEIALHHGAATSWKLTRSERPRRH